MEKAVVSRDVIAGCMGAAFLVGVCVGAAIGYHAATFRTTAQPQTATDTQFTNSARELALKRQADLRSDYELEDTLGIMSTGGVSDGARHSFLISIQADPDLVQALQELKGTNIGVGATEKWNKGLGGGQVDSTGRTILLFTDATHTELRQFLLGHP